jgi:DNA-binding PadR family transcriptional regulator
MALGNVLLVALFHNEATGYEITREFDSTLGHFWQASHQQVYRELGKLESEGLVAYRDIQQEGRPDKKRYRLTAKGRRALKDWLQEPPATRRVNDELLVKVLGGEIIGAEMLQDHIAAKRIEQEHRLALFQGIEREYYENKKLESLSAELRLLYLALRKGIFVSQAFVDWAREAESLLRRRKIV